MHSKNNIVSTFSICRPYTTSCTRRIGFKTIRGVLTLLLVALGLLFLLTSPMFKRRYIYDNTVPLPRPVQNFPLETNGSANFSMLDKISISPEAAALPDKGEILCWVLTSEKYHDTRALAVNQTWISRCDHGVFFTNAPFKKEKRIPYRTVFAGIPDLYANLFYKSRLAFYYISEIMQADFNWFVKADDDTYVIMENLRAYLRTLDPTQPYFVGYRMKPYLEKGYNSGGGGYVLSRKALELFAQHAYNKTTCPDDSFEDVGVSKCLANINIFPHSTINQNGQQRFNGYHPSQTLDGFNQTADWIFDPVIAGVDGIARDLISFHHLSPTEIRLFDILLYRVTLDINSSL